MMKRLSCALAIALVWTAGPVAARAPSDCPLRDARFSTASPLMDIMLSPEARATVEREEPDLLKALPPFLTDSTAPGFSAIITLQEIAGMRHATLGPGIDRALALLPVTAIDRQSRCERYDRVPPRLTIPAGKPRVLLFEKMTGFRDGPSVDAAHAAFVEMAARKGWAIAVTDKGSAMTPAILRRFDVVIWNNVSGDVLTLGQRHAFRRYVEAGGGYVGVHGSGGDPVYYWDWYADNLLGARFLGHPYPKQFQAGRIHLDDPTSPVAVGLPAAWEMTDEWYSFKTSPRVSGSRIVATLDEKTYDPTGMDGQLLRMGDHPIAWTRCVGMGRAFYSAIGHRPQAYGDPTYILMLEQAIDWASAKDDKPCD